MTTATDVQTLPQRVLGKTGERVPILGLGTACGGWGCPDVQAIELYEQAIDRGVTYLDTAPGTSAPSASSSHVVPRRRDEIFLVTKSPTADGAEAVRLLEQNLRDLRHRRRRPVLRPLPGQLRPRPGPGRRRVPRRGSARPSGGG